jgi:hypothetical protein
MLRILHAITGQPVLGEYADRWESYLGRPFDLGIRLAYAAFRDVVLTVKRAGFKP